MANGVRVLGIHPVPGEKHVHLIEIQVDEPDAVFDFSRVTQEASDLPKENWQVAYDEREVGRSSCRVQFAFFFHYLDTSKPLQTASGTVTLPPPSPIPLHLSPIEYDAP